MERRFSSSCSMRWRRVLLLSAAVLLVAPARWCHFAVVPHSPVNCDFANPGCGWGWSEGGFVLLSAENTSWLENTAPDADSEGNVKGMFLYYSAGAAGAVETLEVSSPPFDPFTLPTCQLEMRLYMFNMDHADFKVLMKAPNSTSEINIFHGDNTQTWRIHKQMIGTVRQPFTVILEVIIKSSVFPSHLAIDRIEAVDCYIQQLEATKCDTTRQFQCSELTCIDLYKVCDTSADCFFGEDEEQECDQLPESAYCTFEFGTCGWNSTSNDHSDWVRYRGESPNPRTGPSSDHTYQNATGYYMLARFPPGRKFGATNLFTSPWFSPPPVYHRNIHSPYFNSCQVRFFFHKFGDRIGQLVLQILEHDPSSSEPRMTELWRSYGNKGDTWWQATAMVPHITNRYRLRFLGGRGIYNSDIAIDDVSLSPECFHIGVPANESIEIPGATEITDTRFANAKKYVFGTCGAQGREGPKETPCQKAYLNTSTKVTVQSDPTMEGIQRWTVPDSGIYTLFVKGARGGIGELRDPHDQGLGTFLRATFDWMEGDVIYILIGQKGRDACNTHQDTCEPQMMKRDINAIRTMNRKWAEGGGGGGGGATYVFKMETESSHKVPVAIAGGGGGLSAGVAQDETLSFMSPNAMGANNSLAPINGHTGTGAGGGGGWDDITTLGPAGQSLREGGHGGAVCSQASIWQTDGGFGGGGGSCKSGGGGGGYRGGDASHTEVHPSNGQGGTSYLMPGAIRALVEPGTNEGDGSLTIIPAQKGCGCDHLCVILDLENKAYYCICPPHLTINIDGFSCNGAGNGGLSAKMLAVIILSVIIIISIGSICIIFASARFRKLHGVRGGPGRDASHEPLNDPELQLSRLRNTGGMVTEYNPNYEFGGTTCTAQDLREVPREHLTLVKALGQGAFGEVYQGYLTNPNSESSERPVAVKTLPELSSSQAEMDFLMEALIMSKFNHPNIVSFIGVCFEKLPRFIVLELLPGGDLKSFLRECRPKPSMQSSLTLTDLLRLAMDVAKGCQYLEENHFIHRDIAARNCLLTTKEANRVVKIADFGMARDIYGADYYRKGGKAMLPVKWMPPEAFLDGIFTSKTDVWSFGVLLWEVLSLGYMPYPGRGNQEVMQLVTSGGRLEPPTNCPSPVYHIMMQCWHPHPDERPNFMTIIERLGYCLQDPDVINAPLPVFNRAPSMERDTTLMRPQEDDSGGCLQVQRPDPGLLLSPGSEDYLIPMPQSSCSLASTELLSSPGSGEQLLEMGELTPAPTPPRTTTPDGPGVWETGFTGSAAKMARPFKKQGGYIEIPTEDVEQPRQQQPDTDAAPPVVKPQQNGPLIANGPRSKTSAARLSSIKSLDDLPIAPTVANDNNSGAANVAKHQSNLSLDPAALVRQLATGALPSSSENPNRYVNVDVNCNTGSQSSLGNRNAATTVAATGPFDGYAGVNPVA